MRVLVSGSHGMVGTAVCADLELRGHTVHRLVRGAPSREGDVRWSPTDAEIDRRALAGHDAVIHLAGEPIVGRWTAKKRSAIRSSRVLGTGFLTSELAALDTPPSVVICASAVGYYGHGGGVELTEQASRGKGFLAGVVEDWENAAEPARAAGIRTVHLRSGQVLSPNGGSLQRLLLPFRMGAGGRVGSGRQYWAWIGLHEQVNIIATAIDDDRYRGVINVVGPEQVTNAEFTKALGRVLGRPTPFPVPGAALKVAMGDLVDEMLLASQRVVPARLDELGYDFQDTTLEQALRRELGRAA